MELFYSRLWPVPHKIYELEFLFEFVADDKVNHVSLRDVHHSWADFGKPPIVVMYAFCCFLLTILEIMSSVWTGQYTLELLHEDLLDRNPTINGI
jgi:hypothetical protein